MDQQMRTLSGSDRRAPLVVKGVSGEIAGTASITSSFWKTP